jgi:O-succinylbenzoate synthase
MSLGAHENISQLPLLSEETVESAHLQLTALANAVAAAQSGKMPSSEQIASMVQKVLKSNLLQPGLGGRVAGKIGGGESPVAFARVWLDAAGECC